MHVSRNGLAVKMEGHGETVEWAVKMERLPEEATLEKRLQRGQVGVGLLKALARKVAFFHARAEAGEHISAFSRFEVVSRNARENFRTPDIALENARITQLRLQSHSEMNERL